MKNRTKVTIKGLNQERALNNISKKIKIFNIIRQEGGISQFEVERRNRKTLKNMLESHGVQILSISNRGPLTFLKRLLHSYGVIAALALIVLSYVVQYNFVFRVAVFGAERADKGQIERFVERSLGSRLKSQIDTKKLENELRKEFEDISSVSVAIVGQSVVVNINQIEVPQEMGDDFAPLISQFDGRISQINLVQGTLAINEGDIVKKGDILVFPYVIDSQGQQRQTMAKADIYADVWFEEKVCHYDCLYKQQRTGKTLVLREVMLGNNIVYSNNAVNNFAQYQTEFSLSPISKNNLLPLVLKKTTYYETEIVQINEPFSEKKEQIIQNARQNVLIFLQENEIIKEETYTIKEESGWHEVSYVITVNRNIGG